jgi:hypothetical protein
MKILSKIIDYRLQNSSRSVRKEIISINNDWVKVTTEMFKSSRFLIDRKIVIIMSSSSETRLKEKKKNRKTSFVVLFFSKILMLTKKKKNQRIILVLLFLSKMLRFVKKNKNRKIIFVNLFFDRFSSSFSLTFSLIEFSLAIQSSSSSLSSTALRDLAVMIETLMNKFSVRQKFAAMKIFSIWFTTSSLRSCCRLARSSSLRFRSSCSFFRRLFVRLAFARELMNYSYQRLKKEADWRTIIAIVRYHRNDSMIWRMHAASKIWKELNIFWANCII